MVVRQGVPEAAGTPIPPAAGTGLFCFPPVAWPPGCTRDLPPSEEDRVAQGPVIAITSHWRSLRRSLPGWLGFPRKVTFSSEPPTAMGMTVAACPEGGSVQACGQRMLPWPVG